MKKKIFVSLILFISCVCIAQQSNFNKDAELQKFVQRGGKISEVSSNIYKLTYPDGLSRVYNLNKKENIVENFEGIDTTIINVWEIDTTKFNHFFKYWQKVQLANGYWIDLPIADINKNGRPELYGYTDYLNIGLYPGGPVKIFERDLNGIFWNFYTYDSTDLFVQGMGDIHGTGGREIFIRSSTTMNGVVYKSDSAGVLPTTFDFIFYYEPTQLNYVNFGDFDFNQKTDCAFVEGASAQICAIAEYRKDVNNFETVFFFHPLSDEFDFSDFTINDFDQDGKTEFVFSTGAGNVFVIENTVENQYSLISNFPLSSYNAYMITRTDDIDGNGKPEFWIGMQDFVDGISRLKCYEAYGNNNYTLIAYIELRYLTSLFMYYLQAADIDSDDNDELIVSIGNVILIMKFDGKPNEHSYNVFYAKMGEATQPGAEFFPVAISDLDGDNQLDLLIPFRKYQHPYEIAFSYILRQDKVTSINPSEGNINKEAFINSYPNPFNSISRISFRLYEAANANVKIFNALGVEINVLLEKELHPGNYEITWDAKDSFGNTVQSGIYLIVLQTNKTIVSTKTVLLK
jgi:hypothetical protein